MYARVLANIEGVVMIVFVLILIRILVICIVSKFCLAQYFSSTNRQIFFIIFFFSDWFVIQLLEDYPKNSQERKKTVLQSNNKKVFKNCLFHIVNPKREDKTHIFFLLSETYFIILLIHFLNNFMAEIIWSSKFRENFQKEKEKSK